MLTLAGMLYPWRVVSSTVTLEIAPVVLVNLNQGKKEWCFYSMGNLLCNSFIYKVAIYSITIADGAAPALNRRAMVAKDRHLLLGAYALQTDLKDSKMHPFM